MYTLMKWEKGKKTQKSGYNQKNPMEGRLVIFVENATDNENADGVRGHLEAIGYSDYSAGLYETVIKRAIDIVLAFCGLLLFAPLMATIALLIKIEDPGPVLFTQKRVGKNKRYFILHKFRSMKMNTPHDVPTHMLDKPEEYITKIGKFIRTHSLDELPQIWDILVGNMSVIGPRPGLWNQDYLIAEREKYSANEVKPGLTGWAQVNGRDELDIRKKAELDGEYVANIGFLMDVRIFLMSLHVFKKDDSIVEGRLNESTSSCKNSKIAICRSELDYAEFKKILIVGENSYIGLSFKQYMSQYDNYVVDTCSARNGEWKKVNFSAYDVVYDVAGIAHVKETNENRHLYYEINRDLAYELAKKARCEGVKNYIYLSSMSVYGMLTGTIDKNTVPKPVNAYGKSKLEAEELLWTLEDGNFKVSVVRPPMVYGEGCKGNYQALKRFALMLGFFPNYDNERSAINIDILSAAVRGIIHNHESGVYFPQDITYTKTYDMARSIVEENGKVFRTTNIVNLPIKFMVKRIKVFKKVFGTLVYDQSLNVPEKWIKDNGLHEESANSPLVSILTVSYNSEKTIAHTIEAVLNQTYCNIEYIIIDGASTDGTAEVARKYQQRFDETPGRQLLVISEPDKGMYHALNKGAKMANGILVGQTNADDHYELNAVETMVELYEKTHYDVAWGSINVVKPSGNTIKHAKLGRKWTTSGWCHPAMFSKREILLETPYICESLYDDFDFITSVHQQGKKIVTIDRVISNFNFGGMSTKRNLREVRKRVDALYKVYRRHGMSRWYYLQRWTVELAKYILG